MRWVYTAIIVVFVLTIAIFLFQNTEAVSVSFLGWGLGAPLAVIVLIVYGLGALTGGSLYALLRRSYQGYREV
jgi:lipopolysaccharide assembly protein A